MRPDRLTIALSNFIIKTLPNGANFVDNDSALNFE